MGERVKLPEQEVKLPETSRFRALVTRTFPGYHPNSTVKNPQVKGDIGERRKLALEQRMALKGPEVRFPQVKVTSWLWLFG